MLDRAIGEALLAKPDEFAAELARFRAWRAPCCYSGASMGNGDKKISAVPLSLMGLGTALLPRSARSAVVRPAKGIGAANGRIAALPLPANMNCGCQASIT